MLTVIVIQRHTFPNIFLIKLAHTVLNLDFAGPSIVGSNSAQPAEYVPVVTTFRNDVLMLELDSSRDSSSSK